MNPRINSKLKRVQPTNSQNLSAHNKKGFRTDEVLLVTNTGPGLQRPTQIPYWTKQKSPKPTVCQIETHPTVNVKKRPFAELGNKPERAEEEKFYECVSKRLFEDSDKETNMSPKIEDSWLREQLIRDVKTARDQILTARKTAASFKAETEELRG